MADIVQRFYEGRVVEQWDDNTRTYTAWDDAGTQTQQRPYTADENTAADARAADAAMVGNRASLQTKAANALAANVTFLGIASPTSAQAIAQVGVLTKECSALIRLLLNLLDSTAGT